MRHVFKALVAAAVLSAGLFTSRVQASVVIEATRVIFPAKEREVTVRLANNGNSPALVQAWLDNGNANSSPDKITVPFTITPSMFRLDPNKGQTLRVIYTKEPLAQDKETMFWLNVLEVPPKVAHDAGADENKLQLAFRTRIKLLFRPQGLPGKAAEAPAKTTWEVVRDEGGKGYALKATNPTPYFVNLGEVTFKTGGKQFAAGAGFVKPGESQLFPIMDLAAQPGADAEVDFISLNDFGGGVQGKQLLGGAQPAK